MGVFITDSYCDFLKEKGDTNYNIRFIFYFPCTRRLTQYLYDISLFDFFFGRSCLTVHFFITDSYNAFFFSLWKEMLPVFNSVTRTFFFYEIFQTYFSHIQTYVLRGSTRTCDHQLSCLEDLISLNPMGLCTYSRLLAVL